MTLLDLVSSLISCKFLNPNIFFPIFSNLLYLRNLQERVKKHSVTKNCSDLSLLEQIVLVISKFLQILGLQNTISVCPWR